jgi:hypothetical protein
MSDYLASEHADAKLAELQALRRLEETRGHDAWERALAALVQANNERRRPS